MLEKLGKILFKVKRKIVRKGNRLITKRKSIKDIPVIINNFNRLFFLDKQIKWLERAGLHNIVILDNASTYPPLLDYYKNCPYEIIFLGKNVGHLALWETPVFNRFKYDYYIYTDPDVVPVDECPENFLSFFFDVLKRYPQIDKIGFGLKIDDLPDHYSRKTEVIEWEKMFWKKEVEAKVFSAPVDTTFALYRPLASGGHETSAFRTGFPFIARHLPWYEDSNQNSAEDQYYRQNFRKGVSFWFTENESLQS